MSRSKLGSFRIAKLYANRSDGIVESFWIEQSRTTDHGVGWWPVQHCKDWHEAINALERWSECFDKRVLVKSTQRAQATGG